MSLKFAWYGFMIKLKKSPLCMEKKLFNHFKIPRTEWRQQFGLTEHAQILSAIACSMLSVTREGGRENVRGQTKKWA